MKVISKNNKGICCFFLLYVINIYIKNALVVPLKDEKRNTMDNVFRKV